MKPLKIGIVGAGAIAQRNAKEAKNSKAAEIAGVFDVNQKVARDMAKSLSANFFQSYEDMLNDQTVEAVLISTPHYLHLDQILMAARKGKHILVEKPMAISMEEAEEIRKECENSGVKLTVNYSFRYLHKIQEAKRIVDSGALGDIIGIQIISHQYKDPGYWTGARSNSPSDWRAKKDKSGGGLLIMTTCHNIDYIYYITGLKAERVYAEYGTMNSKAEVEDYASITCRFNNQAIGTIIASSVMRGMNQSEERIIGTKGTLLLNEEGISFYSTRVLDGKRPGKVHKIKKFKEVNWTANWVIDFVDAVRNDTTPLVSIQEGWENLAFLTSAYQSMDLKKAVDVPQYPQ